MPSSDQKERTATLLKDKRFIIFSILVLVGIFVGVMSLTDTAQSQKNGEDAWIHRCAEEDKSRCEIAQRLSETESGKRVVEVIISDVKDDNGMHRGVIILPLGVAFQTGFNLQVDDGQTYNFNVSHCLPNGCFAPLSFPNELISEMKKGEKATLKMHTFQGQAVNVDLSLIGFTKTFDKIG